MQNLIWVGAAFILGIACLVAVTQYYKSNSRVHHDAQPSQP